MKHWILKTDLIFSAILIIAALTTQSKELSLIVLSLITLLYIVFGEDIERKILKNPFRVEGSREWVTSALLAAVLFSLGFVEFNSFKSVVFEKWDIIGLIMSFALLAQGIGDSGYFKFAAYRITESCGGSTTRLTLYLFVLTSALTLITSNDVVILVLTPIIIQIAYYADIKNAKLLLLSQFVAANTLSMGLLIGSPTNIIFGASHGYGFFEYIWLMIIPTITAFMVSFIVVHAINKHNRTTDKNKSKWAFNKKYIIPVISRKQNYTKEMTYWLLSFIFAIALVALTTSIDKSLGWVVFGIVLAVAAIHFIPRKSKKTTALKTHISTSIKELPFQIIPFALVFFVITQELSNSGLGLAIGEWVLSSDSYYLTSQKGMMVSGGLVNLFNDLPASAFLSSIIDPNIANKDMVSRAILVGLNIGCYVTPIGALAGIIWIHKMKSEVAKTKTDSTQNDGIQIPTRSGLLKYGIIHFIAAVFVLSLVLPSVSHLQNISTIQWVDSYQQNHWVFETLLGVGAFFGITVVFRRVLQKNNVILGDMRVFLGLTTWVGARKREHSTRALLLLFIVVIAALAVPIFHAENWGAAKLAGVLNVIIESGGGLDFPDSANMIPKTTIGVILISALPIASLFLLIKLMLALNKDKPIDDTAFKLATGEIQSHRIVVIMDEYKQYIMEFITDILKTKNNTFVTIIVSLDDKTKVQGFLNAKGMNINTNNNHYIDFLTANDPSDMVGKFNLEKADEVYLFSKKEVSKKIANSLQIRLLDGNKLKLKNKERYPKIFAQSDIFDNHLVKENYIIDLPINKTTLEKIHQKIYNNDLTKNNYQALKKLVAENSV